MAPQGEGDSQDGFAGGAGFLEWMFLPPAQSPPFSSPFDGGGRVGVKKCARLFS
jgi:hypothetical protein